MNRAQALSLMAVLAFLSTAPAAAVLVGTPYQRLEPGDRLEAESVTLGCYEPHNTGENPILGVGNYAINIQKSDSSASGGSYLEVAVSGLGGCLLEYNTNTPPGAFTTVRLRSHVPMEWYVAVSVDGEHHAFEFVDVGTSWSTFTLRSGSLDTVREGANLVRVYVSQSDYSICDADTICRVDVDYVGTSFDPRSPGGYGLCDIAVPSDSDCDTYYAAREIVDGAIDDVLSEVEDFDCTDVFSPTVCSTVGGAEETAHETADWAVDTALEQVDEGRTTTYESCLIVFSPEVCAPLAP